MKRRTFLKQSALSFGAVAVSGHSIASATSADKTAPKSQPNIVFVLTDDQGYGDVGAHGNPILKTPNMDKLRSQSVRFSDFSVSPCCAPTRCVLMTGMHEFKSGVTHTIPPYRDMNQKSHTIAQALKSAGYATGLFGKWHLGLGKTLAPHARGFDVSLTAKGDSQNSHNNPTLLRNGKSEKHKGFRTDILFDEAMKFIADKKAGPFFCYIPTYSPHAPLKCPAKFSDPYEGKCTKSEQLFFGMIANIDYNLGRLMDHLDKLELAENTLVILMNDNGATKGTDVWNAKMRGTKGTTWRGGTRAISFWRWGGQFKPADVPDMTAHLDVYPTLVDLCNLQGDTRKNDQGAPLDGFSMRPLLANPEAGQWDGPDGALTMRFAGPQNNHVPTRQHWAYRTERYRYIIYNDG
ncbi:MAG: sulfatase-like hydrolase/transferase, partial [Phycisphaerales bacterium]|nr:sulfatase-like hydrolase/transferase [Phycisphaerales bacterium]